MKKILVTGGAGYIGSHTVLALHKKGYDVAIVDNLSTSCKGSVAALEKLTGKCIPFYETDIRNEEEMTDILKREHPDAVIHFAAFSLVGESVSNPLKYYENNLYGTEKLLKAMLTAGTDKIVFSSTAAVYGEPKHIPIVETDKTEPTNPYGETKLAMEKMFRWTANAGNLSYVSLRYFNACGADASGLIGEAHNPETHLIPCILRVANGQEQFVRIFGTDYPTADGTCVRDYIHVTDLADAHVLAVEYLLGGGKSDIFNLGNGQGFSVRQIVETVRAVTHHPIPQQIAPRRAGDPAVLVASSQKAREVLGWNPQLFRPQDIVASAWKWHQTHPNGYKNEP